MKGKKSNQFNTYISLCVNYKGWQEPENARGTNIYGQTSDVPKEVPYSKHLASKEEGSTESHKAAALPLRVTRVITATLPSALTAHRVSVQDPPPELLNPLPEQIPQTLPKRTPSKPLRLSSQYSVPASEAAVPRSVQLARQRSEIIGAKAPEQSRQYCTLKENTLGQELDGDALSRGLDENRREQVSFSGIFILTWPYSVGFTTVYCVSAYRILSHEQREAKLKRVERIRQRVIRR